MEKARYYATGKRKTAIARVWLVSGTGAVSINNEVIDSVNRPQTLKMNMIKPLILTNTQGRYDVLAHVKGGGQAGQMEAIMYGIAKALNTVSEEYRKILKAEGLLSRDARIVERKKYNLKKARKATQYRKR